MSGKKVIKRVIKRLLSKFKKTTYINNYIFKGELLKGRVALITGGTSGIGLAIAKSFLKNGCDVIITGRKKEKVDFVVNELINDLEDKNQKVYGFVFDISDVDSIQTNFETIEKALGDKVIDILVNNAGVLNGSNIGETKVDEFELCMKTNIEGTYFLSQSFFNYLKNKKRNGNILNVCSSSSLRPVVNPYSLTKWGLKGLTIGMAKKFIEYGIVVNGIAPGPTYTKMLIGEDMFEKNIILESSPTGRYATPEEIANGALFLVSDLGKMIIGDIIYMTGGAGITTFDDTSY